MNGPSVPTRVRSPYFWPAVIVGIALALIVVILLATSSKEEPLVKDATEPIAAAQTGTTDPNTPTVVDQEHGEIPATQGAIDGAGVKPAEQEADVPLNDDEHADDHAHAAATPSDEAAEAGSYMATATKFAELSINRSTDEAASIGLNKKLVRLAAGTLAVDLDNSQGGVATAQVASSGEVIKALSLKKTPAYAEVLIVAKESIVDAATGVTLDPKYVNYLVRLDQVGSGRFAVTSWEPQL